ncbi:MAG: hypothetical protein U5K74_16230 [Gemmatimonadaceae bacterium]|nr:hypothetical protein [Gemmatimonadaceae bacterium]
MFKHPQPADFFRSIEDGAGEQLNYFWRGWFYTTTRNDQALATVETRAARSAWPRRRPTCRTASSSRTRAGSSSRCRSRSPSTTAPRSWSARVSIWRNNEKKFEYGRFSQKELQSVELDPDNALADINPANNKWSRPAAALP